MFQLESINAALPPLDPPPNLETPQACLENFILSAKKRDYDRAARSLNFRLIQDLDESRARELARRLEYVVQQKTWIDWTLLPDRPDGLDPGSSVSSNDPLAGKPRRAIEIDTISIDGRVIPIYLQRVQASDSAAQWLMSAHSVENIDALYARFGPPWIEEHLPQWARERFWGGIPVWQWIGLVLLLATSALIALGVTGLVARFVRTIGPGHVDGIADRLRWPIAAVAFSGSVHALAGWLLALPSPISSVFDTTSLTLLVLSLSWFAMQAISISIERVTTRFIDREEPTAESRRRMTQMTIARHLATLLVGLIGVSILLIELGAFRVIGIVLLTSAGAAAVLFGLAGQAVLGNAIAGLQIAFTQPFRIGDAVYVDGNWGRIEKITYTYVDIKTWDARRLVVPIQHFVSKPFENWSKNDSFLTKPIYLHIDYRADVDRIRTKFMELVKADEDWDGEQEDPECLVTDSDGDTLTVRLTAGAADPSAAWSMSCRIREAMFTWLKTVDDGSYLPRRRFELTPSDESTSGGRKSATDLLELSRDELYERARERDLSGRSDMSKQELVDALSEEPGD